MSIVNNKSVDLNSDKLPIEEVMNQIGFGLYGVIQTCLTGLILFSLACLAFGTTFIVPTSACELETTTTQQGLLGAVTMASLLLGSVLWSYLADTRGRRAVLLIGLTGGAIFNIIGSLSVNWIMLLVFQFLGAFFAAGHYPNSMTLLSECIPMRNRNTAVLAVSCVFLAAQGLMALIVAAWFAPLVASYDTLGTERGDVLVMPIIPLNFSHYLPSLGIYWNSWRTTMAVFSVPNIIAATVLFFMQESPKFLFTKGKEMKASEALRSIHKVNHWRSKKPLEVKHLIPDDTITTEESAKEKLILLFKAPLLKYTIIMLFMNIAQQLAAFQIWMPTIADQIVRSVEGSESTDLTVCDILRKESGPIDPDETPCALDETSLLVVFGVGIITAFLNLIISFLVNYVGRRNITIFWISFCGISGILINLVPNMFASAVFFLILLMGTIVLGLCTAICIALYPTNLRSFAISFTMLAQYIGVITAVQIVNVLLQVNCDAAFYIYSSLYTSAAVAAIFLPDDRRIKMTESSERVSEDPEEHSNKENKLD